MTAELIVIGANHKTAPVEDRERALLALRGLPGVLLATCNRVELYTMTLPAGRQGNEPMPIDQQGFYYYKNEKAVLHLFRVAAGLESQILGETEILGQVSNTYLKAKKEGNLDPVLDMLFAMAIAVSRRVRSETGISRGKVSIAGVAVSKAKQLLGNVEKRKIVLIGTGKITESIIKTLLKHGCSLIFIANRTYKKAKELAGRIGGRAVYFNKLREELIDADLVISSTSAPHIILKKEQIGQRVKPLAIIDLAVPRDVDPAVSQIPGVKLLNIDDIKEAININLARRRIEAVFAERIVEEEVEKFCLPAAGGRKIRIGSRPSLLAWAQVKEITGLLTDCDIEVIHFETTGDKDKDTPIDKMEGSDFFTDRLESELLNLGIDLAVHSAKDLPEKIPEGLSIAVFTESIDKRDALVAKNNLKLNELPAGAKVGTSSLRRKAQLLEARPDFDILDLRGNIDERLKKLDGGEYDAIIVAAAALLRLGQKDRISEYLPFETANRQGSLALEIRESDKKLKEWLNKKFI